LFCKPVPKLTKNLEKPMIFLVCCNKTSKNQWFFNVLLQKTKKTIGFSRLLVSFGIGLQKNYQHIFFSRGPEIQIP